MILKHKQLYWSRDKQGKKPMQAGLQKKIHRTQNTEDFSEEDMLWISASPGVEFG